MAALLALMLLAVPPAGAQTTPTDYDADDDQLIEVSNLAQLDAIRHDLDGNGDATHADYIAAFPNRDTTPATRMGCPSGMACNGYELTADLNFDSDDDGDVDANDHAGLYWDSGAGWTPLGNNSTPFTATFNGNGHTIANLFISRAAADRIALFGQVSGGTLRRVGLTRVNITGQDYAAALAADTLSSVQIADSYATGRVSGRTNVGGLVGDLAGTITASYAAVQVTGSGSQTGGLAGRIWSGSITAAYATGAVNGDNRVGGLVGFITAGDTVRAGYATGRVSGSSNTGGLVGQNAGTVTDGLYNSQRSGQSDAGRGDGQTTRLLQQTDSYTGIYMNWNVDLSSPADGTPDDPWDFGGPREYPRLKVDFNGDGDATWEEFGYQHRYIPPPPPSPPPYNPAHDHPEIYQNARHEMATSCEVRTTGEGDDAISTATLTFDLGDYTRPLTLALSLWDGTHFRSLQSQNIAMPELQQTGQTATVEVVTDPAQTRFRLDSQYGLNLVLGYADCHTDDL